MTDEKVLQKEINQYRTEKEFVRVRKIEKSVGRLNSSSAENDEECPTGIRNISLRSGFA
jgi:hypothetical protein